MRNSNNDFDREFNTVTKIIKTMFVLVGLLILVVFAGQCYLLVHFGPKVLNTADKGLDKANKFLDE